MKNENRKDIRDATFASVLARCGDEKRICRFIACENCKIFFCWAFFNFQCPRCSQKVGEENNKGDAKINVSVNDVSTVAKAEAIDKDGNLSAKV